MKSHVGSQAFSNLTGWARTYSKFLISGLFIVVVAAVIIRHADGEMVRRVIGLGSAAFIAPIFVATSLSLILASIRLRMIASDIRQTLRFREALAAVAGGVLGGVAFFQLFGQLMARGALLSRHGIGIGPVVVMTAYERLTAALVSVVLAVAGAI